MKNLDSRVTKLESQIFADSQTGIIEEKQMLLLRYLNAEELESIVNAKNGRKLKELMDDLMQIYSEQIEGKNLNIFEKLKLELLKQYPPIKLRKLASGDDLAWKEFDERLEELIKAHGEK